MKEDKLIIGGHEFNSRFILGSGKYSMKLIESAIKDAGAEIITLAVRRANTKEEENILDFIPEGNRYILKLMLLFLIVSGELLKTLVRKFSRNGIFIEPLKNGVQFCNPPFGIG